MSIFVYVSAAIVALSIAAHLWFHRALVFAFALSPRTRVALAVVQACVAGLPMLRWVAGPLGAPGLRPVAQWAMVPQLVLFLSFSCVLAARLVARGRRRSSPLPTQRELARRDLIVGAAAAALPTVAATYGAAIGRHDVIIEEVAIRVPRLPRALDGFTLVQVSDLHVGPFTGEAELRVLEDRVRAARGDLVVVTGDVLDNDLFYVPLAARWLPRLAARHGVVAIPGNHDHYAGMAEVMAALQKAGLDVLLNRSTVIAPGLTLVGVDDLWGRHFKPGPGPDLAGALRGIDPDDATVLLAHNPKFFDEARGKVGLQLSGHTHGGQIAPGGALLKYSKGLYREGESALYVNRGYGVVGPPVRIGAPPEVTRIVLVSG